MNQYEENKTRIINVLRNDKTPFIYKFENPYPYLNVSKNYSRKLNVENLLRKYSISFVPNSLFRMFDLTPIKNE